MLPGERRSEKPEPAEWTSRNSKRKPILIRGNKKNNKMTSGAAWPSSLQVVPSGGQNAPGDDPRWNWISATRSNVNAAIRQSAIAKSCERKNPQRHSTHAIITIT